MPKSTVLSTLARFIALLPSVLAFPIVEPNLPRSTLTAAQLEAIAPTSTTCAGAAHPSECRTASQAVPFIVQSFQAYGIDSPGEQAALLSTMAFESDEFKYQKNYTPGNPGQGTRNMQSAAFNVDYAQSITDLSASLAAAESSGPSGVRDLLISNDYHDFGSAAWFLTTQCGPDVKNELVAGGMTGFMAYLSCVGTSMTPDREAYWERANSALGTQGSG